MQVPGPLQATSPLRRLFAGQAGRGSPVFAERGSGKCLQFAGTNWIFPQADSEFVTDVAEVCVLLPTARNKPEPGRPLDDLR